MPSYANDTFLIVTKTYPSPSKKYRETSCVAAINKDGFLRRLFPIPYRMLDGKYQFKRWEWIQADAIKASDDHRPESYKLNTDSITRLGKLGTTAGWAERYQRIEPHIVGNFETLDARRESSEETLGFIRPKNYKLVITQADNSDWTEDEKSKLIQDGLFDSPKIKNRIPLRKIPYDFYYYYECETNSDNCIHKHKITDWEVGALYWTCQKRYGTDWERYFRQKLETEFLEKRELLLLMGTIHRFPNQWLIVGLFYPPKMQARQRSLLLPVPDA